LRQFREPGIDDGAWTTIKYPNAIFDDTTGTWICKAEVAEVPFTAFASTKKTDRVAGRLVVRRIPDVHAERKKAAGQATLFDVWRFHAFFTTAPAHGPGGLDTVAADKTHRGHAIIEQVHADLKSGDSPYGALMSGAGGRRGACWADVGSSCIERRARSKKAAAPPVDRRPSSATLQSRYLDRDAGLPRRARSLRGEPRLRRGRAIWGTTASHRRSGVRRAG
jgi:hypothetical protein